MSREIDERVVQMKFEADSFNRNIQASIKNLDGLEKRLDFKNAINGFTKLDKAARNTNISELGKAVEMVQVKFSMFEVFALNVMNRISNAAINAGEHLVKSLTIDQITPGWDKYADKTGSVQTIMAATAKQFTDTGKQMEYVNSQLDKLNWFTDETSYNFVDMTSNIGKFTSNNIELDKSVTAMQGIANWAAISGANANEASRAMYNLSQAMSSGSLRLQDWMSIENANMGTAAFKEMAIESALAAGTLVKVGDKVMTANKKVEVSVESFRETLSEKWLSGDVLMATLNEYGAATNKLHELYETTGKLTSTIVENIDEYSAGTKTAEEISKEWGLSLEETTATLEEFQTETMQFGLKAFKAAQEAKTFSDAIDSVKDAVSTGWMKSFEYIFGDYMQAKVLWTDLANNLYDIFAAGAEARNDMLASWSKMGGRDMFVDTIWASLSAILRILGPIKQAWNDVFGIDAAGLLNITSKLRDFVIALNISEDSMRKLRTTARGFFSIFEIGWTIIKAAASAFASVLARLIPFSDGLLDATSRMGEFLTNLSSTVKETKIFDKVFGGIADVIIQVVDIFVSAVKLISNGFRALSGFENVTVITDSLSSLATNGLAGIINIGGAFRKIVSSIIQSFIKAIPNANNLAEAIVGLFKALSNPFSDFNFNTALDLLNAGLFAEFILTFKKGIKSLNNLNISKLFSSISEAFSTFGLGIEAFEEKLRADSLRSIAVSILILAGAMVVLASIESEKLTSALAATIGLFSELYGITFAFSKTLDEKSLRGMTKLGAIFIVMATAVSILASAVKKLSDLEWDGLLKGLTGVGALMGELTLSMVLLSNGTGRITKGSVGLIAFAAAIVILVESVTKLSTIEWEDLVKGLIGVGVLMAELVIFLNTTSKGFKITSGVGLIALSSAIIILTQAIEKLSDISAGQIIQGLISLGVILAEISIFMNSVSGAKHVLSAAVSMLILSTAIRSLIGSIIMLSNGLAEDIAGALINLGIALGEIVIAMKLLPKDILVKSASLLVFANAISILSKALITMGAIDSVVTALIALGGSLTIITIAANKMAKGLSGASAMLVFASALTILAPAINAFGSMNIGLIGMALLSLVSIFAILGGAAKILGPLTPTITKLSFAIAAFSVSVALLGAGVTLLSVGLASLGASAVVGIGGLTTALLGIIDIIPSVAESLAKGIISFAGVIVEGAPIIAAAVTTVIISLLESMSEAVPQIVDLVIDIITQIVATIAGRVGDLKEAGKMLFGGFSDGVSSGVKDIAMSIAVLVPSLVGAVKMLGGAEKMKKGSAKTIVAMVGVVAAIGILLIAFSHIPMGNVDNAVSVSAGIAMLMPVLAISFGILSKFNGDISMKTVAQFTIMSAVAVAVGALISVIGMLPSVDKSIEVAKALTVLMPALVASYVALSKFSGELSMKTVAQFGIITAISVAAGAATAAIGSIKGVENSIEAAKAIATLMIPLAAVVKILSGPQLSNAGAAWSNLALLGTVVLALGAMAIGIGELMQDPAFSAAISDSASGMTALGKAIGGFFGGIASGLVEGALSFIPTVGTYLSDFMENAKGFFDAAKDLPPGIGDNIKDLAVALLALTATELLNGITSFLGSVFGVSSDDLAEKFASFGRAITAFSESIGEGFDAEKVSAAANAGHALAELEGALPKQGGVLQDWLGSQSLDDFGERIKKFGTAIKDFAKEVEGITPENVQGAADAGKMLSDLESSLPSQDGILQSLIGSKSFDDFGPGLLALGEGLKGFSDSITGLNYSNITLAADSVRTLVDLENGIEASGGWGEIFTGKSDFSSFGTHVEALGDALVSYSECLVSVDLVKIKDTNIVITGLLAIARTSGNVGSNLTSLATNISSLKIAFSDYDLATKGMDITAMTNARTEIENLLKLSELTNASAWIEDITLHANAMMSRLNLAIQSRYASLKKTGEWVGYWLIEGVKQGIKDNEYKAKEAATNLGASIQQAFEDRLKIASPSVVMEDDGKWIVRGIAEGIKNDMSAEEAIVKKAQNIESAFKDALESLDLDFKSKQLDLQLWSVNEGLNAGNEEVAERQRALDLTELEYLADTARNKRAIMQTMAQEFGETSKQFIEANNNWKEAMISMYQKKNEIDEYMKANVEDENAIMVSFATHLKEASEFGKMLGWSEQEMEDYASKQSGYNIENARLRNQTNELIRENTEAFEMLGKSREELEAWAREQTGYSLDNAASDISKTSEIIARALEDQEVTIEKAVSKTTKKLTSDMATAGSNSTEGLAEGVQDDAAVSNVTKAVEYVTGSKLLGATMDILQEHSPSKAMEQIGIYAVEGLAIGIQNPDSISRLLNGSQYLANMVLNTLENISETAKAEGVNFIDGFVLGLQNAAKARSGLVKTAVSKIVNDAINVIRNTQDSASPSKVTMKLGNDFVDGYAIGISESGDVEDAAGYLAETAANTVATKAGYESGEEIGSDFGQGIVKGIESKVSDAKMAASKLGAAASQITSSTLTSSAVSGGGSNGGFVRVDYDKIYGMLGMPTSKDADKAISQLGKNVSSGLAKGISSGTSEIKSASKAAASTVTTTMAATLQVRSPSRLTQAIGNYVSIGLGNGIIEKANYITDASDYVSNELVSSMSYAAQAVNDIVNNDEDFSPVITPVLDMDELKRGAGDIPGLLNSDRSISLTSAKLRVAQLNAEKANTLGQNGSQNAPTSNYSFVQNNYSPKALNRSEIYRQTNNQFSRIKEATKR